MPDKRYELAIQLEETARYLKSFFRDSNHKTLLFDEERITRYRIKKLHEFLCKLDLQLLEDLLSVSILAHAHIGMVRDPLTYKGEKNIFAQPYEQMIKAQEVKYGSRPYPDNSSFDPFEDFARVIKRSHSFDLAAAEEAEAKGKPYAGSVRDEAALAATTAYHAATRKSEDVKTHSFTYKTAKAAQLNAVIDFCAERVSVCEPVMRLRTELVKLQRNDGVSKLKERKDDSIPTPVEVFASTAAQSLEALATTLRRAPMQATLKAANASELFQERSFMPYKPTPVAKPKVEVPTLMSVKDFKKATTEPRKFWQVWKIFDKRPPQLQVIDKLLDAAHQEASTGKTQCLDRLEEGIRLAIIHAKIDRKWKPELAKLHVQVLNLHAAKSKPKGLDEKIETAPLMSSAQFRAARTLPPLPTQMTERELREARRRTKLSPAEFEKLAQRVREVRSVSQRHEVFREIDRKLVEIQAHKRSHDYVGDQKARAGAKARLVSLRTDLRQLIREDVDEYDRPIKKRSSELPQPEQMRAVVETHVEVCNLLRLLDKKDTNAQTPTGTDWVARVVEKRANTNPTVEVFVPPPPPLEEWEELDLILAQESPDYVPPKELPTPGPKSIKSSIGAVPYHDPTSATPANGVSEAPIANSVEPSLTLSGENPVLSGSQLALSDSDEETSARSERSRKLLGTPVSVISDVSPTLKRDGSGTSLSSISSEEPDCDLKEAGDQKRGERPRSDFQAAYESLKAEPKSSPSFFRGGSLDPKPKLLVLDKKDKERDPNEDGLGLVDLPTTPRRSFGASVV